MGLRGFPPKPTAVRVMEGMRGHRPLPANEPSYPAGTPEQPAGMSAAARRVWDVLVPEMAASGVLRTVDGLALAQLCEDQAALDEMRRGLQALTKELAKSAKKQKKALPGGPLVSLARTTDGRRLLGGMRELAAQIIVQRREFGLTPASNSRVETAGGAGGSARMDPLEAALCG